MVAPDAPDAPKNRKMVAPGAPGAPETYPARPNGTLALAVRLFADKVTLFGMCGRGRPRSRGMVIF